MPIKENSMAKLQAENEKLREELEELREIIRAVQSGEVDALVIKTKLGDRVFTLKTADQTYRSLIEEMNEGAVILSDDNTILYCNCGFGDLAKKPINEIIGTNIQNLILPTHLKNFMILLNEGRKGVGKKISQITLKASNGTLVPTQMSANTLALENQDKTTYLVATDLTQHMAEDLKNYTGKLEQEVSQKTRDLKVAERMAAIGQTAGMVGHDLRNPLQTIIGELFLAKEFVKQLKDSQIKDQMKESVGIIEEQILYMNKIILDLQDFAKPVKPEPIPTDLDKLVKEILRDIKAPEAVTVTSKIPKDFPELMLDPSMTKRVFTNLVFNAIQAIPHKGTVTVEAKKTGDYATISFKDTGVGIADEAKQKIFQPLFTTKAKGQGLGLAVVKRFVEAQDGEVGFESQKGKGTTFTVKIPLKPKTQIQKSK